MKNSITRFLISCSGADKDVLKEAELDNPKFASIGAAILLTAALASISGGYAIYSSFNSYIPAILLGLLWAVIIFNIDRYIVVSIDKNASSYRQLGMAIPRLLISFVLAITISKPLELRIFQGSINAKLFEQDTRELLQHDSIVNAKKNYIKKQFIKNEKQSTDDIILDDYNKSRASLLKQQGVLRNSIRLSDSTRKKLLTARLYVVNRQLFISDSLINKRKKHIYSDIEETENLNAEVKRRIYKEMFSIDSLYPIQVAEIKSKQSNRDMLVQLKALADLKASDDTMNMTGYMITLLFILIEMAPVLIKLMASKGLYESVIKTRYDEIYLSQKTKADIIKRDKEQEQALWTLNYQSKIDKIVSENLTEKTIYTYNHKKRIDLSRIKADSWFEEKSKKS